MAVSKRLENGRFAEGPKKGSCSVEGCDRREHCRQYCYPHYFRWYRNGDPGPAEIKVKNPGASCSIEGCSERANAAQGWCQMHYTRWLRHGDPMTTLPRPPMRGEQSGTWLGDDCGYSGVHMRLRSQRGSASLQTCACGSPAKHWAYDHADPNERVAEEGAYSTDLSHYEAKCVPCHKRDDLNHLHATRCFTGGVNA